MPLHDTTASAREKGKDGRLIGLIVLIALMTHLAYFVIDRQMYTPDSQTYILPATNLVRGNGYVARTGVPEVMRTPGYPVLLAVFAFLGLGFQYVVLLQHLIGVALVWVTTSLALRLSGNRVVGATAGLILCFDLATLYAANLLLTEILFTAFLVCIFWLAYELPALRRHLFLASVTLGLLGGLSALVRPISVYLFVALAAYIWIVMRHRRLRTVVIVVISSALLPTAWAFRNYERIGIFTVSPTGSVNLLLYRAAAALAAHDPGDQDVALQRRQAELTEASCRELQARYGRPCEQAPMGERVALYSRLGQQVVVHNLAGYLIAAGRGGGQMFLGGSRSTFMRLTHASRPVATLAVLAISVPSAILAIVGLFYWHPTDRRFFWLASLTIAYFIVISSGGDGQSRLRVPVMPMYAMLIAGGMAAVFCRLSRPAQQRGGEAVARPCKHKRRSLA